MERRWSKPQPDTRPRQIKQYALAYFNRRIGPWRWTRKEAVADALRRGDASRERGMRFVFFTVPANIITRYVEVNDRENPPKPREEK